MTAAAHPPPRFLAPNETLIGGQVCRLVDPEITTAINRKTGAIYRYGVVSAVPVDEVVRRRA